MEGESIIPSGGGYIRPTKITAATLSIDINKNTIDDANNAFVLDDVTFLSSEEQRGHKRRLEDENTEKPPKICNNVENKGEDIDFKDDPDEELGDVHEEVLSSLLGEEAFQGDDDVIDNSNEEIKIGVDRIDDNNTGDGDKIDQVETMVSPVIELPEGMGLEWNDDKTSAILHISKNSNNDNGNNNNNTTNEGKIYNYINRELRVCLVGRAKIKVLEGSAEVLGYNLEHDQNHMLADESDSSSSSPSLSMGVVVTSPYWSSWMTIEANPMSLPCRIAFDCIRGHETFKVMAPKRPIVLPSSWRNCADDFVRDFNDLRATSTTTTAAVMVDSLEDYEDIEERKQQQDHNVRLACMITGAKGTGKSTLLRYMTNRLLSSSSNSNNPRYNNINGVAILDTDVGQPELAPPGLLRLAIVRKPLLRPPYWNLVNGTEHKEDEEKCHTKNDKNLTEGNSDCDDDDATADDNNDNGIEVISSVFFGATTSKVDPTRYITAVQMLMDKYETEIVQTSSDQIPLLINMDGWVKGMGYQILTALIDSLRPTHLVQILGETKSQIFDLPPTFPNNAHDEESSTSATNPPKIYQLPACQILPEASLCRISALTLRNFRWATYFLPDQLQTFDAWDFVSAKLLQTGWIVATNFDKTTTVPYWQYRLRDDNDDDDNDDDGRNSEEITKEHEALNDECRLAQALAREKPYCVPMESVEAFVIGSDFEDYLRIQDGIDATENDIESTRNRIFQALNGSIVALCIDTATMETLGYGILRSIDWNRRLLYVLVPRSVKTTPSALSRIKALVGGNLPLPLAMLYRGVYAESFPYLATILPPSSSTILGSAPMKSRNNIARRGLTKAAAGEAHR